ncbi:MAG: TonB-dependent receptor plug domain-containing protein, partial [Bacteroidota bacterium]
MNKTVALLIFVFSITFSFAQSQVRGPQMELSSHFYRPESFFQTTQKDSLSIWREQVLLHVDSETYKPKETLFFKAYVLTGPKQLRVSASEVLRVELLDTAGDLIADQYHKIQEGSVNGVLELPNKIKDGKYYLRAYTRWMLNYGEENLPVREVLISKSGNNERLEKRTTVIIPEGGQFVIGLENKGIISDDSGNPLNGTIINQNGLKVANVMDYGSGLASFTFLPTPGESYYFQTSQGEKTKLDPPFDEGAVLHVNNIGNQKIQVRVGITSQLKEGKYYLKGSKQGKAYFKSEIIFNQEKDFVDLDINKEGLPYGLLKLRLVDDYDQVWAERPLYNEASSLQFDLTEKTQLLEDGRRKLQYSLRLTDDAGNPISSEVMVNVQDLHNVNSAMAQVSSERGISFFSDLKVLAQRFPEVESDMNNDILPDQISYSFQKGLEFYGQAYDLNNTLLKNETIQIFINDRRDIEVREVATNSEGLFTLTGLQFVGDVTMTFRREGENIKEQLVKVIPYQYELPKLKIAKDMVVAAPNPIRQSGQMIPQKRLSDFDFEDKPSNLIPLESVTLVGRKIPRKVSSSIYGMKPDRVVFQDSKRPKSIPQLFLGLPGVYVSGLGDLNPRLSLPSMSGIGPILWVIDGFPLNQSSPYANTAGSSGLDGFASLRTQTSQLREVMDIVPFVDVERIELLFGANAAIYGSRGSGGVIAIYTKNGSYSTEFVNRNQAEIQFEGFHRNVDFDDFF